MSKKHRLTMIALAAAVSMLLGSGLFALATDSVTSQDNSVRSATFTVPSHDLKAARVSAVPECAPATYLDGPFTAFIQDAEIPLGTPGGAAQEDYFCLRNDGTATGRLDVTFSQIIEQEVGACEASESAAGDTTCEDGAPGELKPLLGVQFIPAGGTSGCGGVGVLGFDFYDGEGQLVDADVAPGATCILSMGVGANLTSSENTYQIAQTDRVQWDVVFTLRDVAP